MAAYLDLTALQARFTERQVQLAFTGKLETSATVVDPNRAENLFVQVEAIAHAILEKAFTVPFSPCPANLLDILQVMVILRARYDSGGCVWSENGKAEWDRLVEMLQKFATGELLLDGVAAPETAGIITSNDDGRAPVWREYHTDDHQDIIETDPEYVPTLEKVL